MPGGVSGAPQRRANHKEETRMRYTVDSSKSVEQLLEDTRLAVQDNGFGVLNIQDLQQTLKNKGFDLDNPCYVLDVCNPRQAVNVLNEDMGMNVALPCRLSVYRENGQSKLAMIKPTALLASLSDSPSLAKVAGEVEETMLKIMEQAR
jgi:uncharacterized protein (DUF302 family)